MTKLDTAATNEAMPESVTLEQALGIATNLHRAGNLDAAAEIYQRVLECAPEHPDALHFMGMLAHDRGQTEEAIRLIARSVELVPDHAVFRSNFGNLMLDNEYFDDAEREYQAALALDPERPDTLNNYGVLCKALKRYEEAEQCLLHAIKLIPDFIDARNNLAGLYTQQRRIDEALEQTLEALKHQPHDARTLEVRGSLYACLGRLDEAAEIYRTWLTYDPENPKALHQLAACTGEQVPDRASDAYIELLFDRFSQSFDSRLASLEYRAPELVGEMVTKCLGDAPAADLSLLDAGCGTGLCAAKLRPYAQRLEGVDLSQGMLDKARRRALYDTLYHAELTKFMADHPACYDFVVSADTLVYFGELTAVLGAAAHTLRPGGHLCFTLEALAEDDQSDHRLCPHGRYAHSRDYARAMLDAAGLDTLEIESVKLRQEAGRPVAGWLVLARKPL